MSSDNKSSIIDSGAAAIISSITSKSGVIFHIIRTTPLKNFYSGISVAIAIGIPALSTYLYMYDNTKYYLSTKLGINNDRVINHMISGALAETVSGMFWTPMEVVKSKLQTGVGYVKEDFRGNTIGKVVGRDNRGGTLNLIRMIFDKEGIRGFYRGYFLALAVFIPHTVTYFVIYEKCKAWERNRRSRNKKPFREDKLDSAMALEQNGVSSSKSTVMANSTPKSNGELPFTRYILYSGFAGGVAASFSNILDVVKTRWQVSFSDNKTHSPRAIIRSMYLNEGGFKAFTKGMGARVLWMVPASAVSMTVFEALKNRRARKKKFE
ncbi:15372_t:CDS:2 [Acaulospora morrowiae]|uniref:15372_t:CDS:1 n=1 Tax=Acaulospora morrowiae TaxID=94023 RepID=A0A9N9FWZ3_9GLOM|nr:15372_t:CDS:2 [Acaulospora morrowiae]